MQRSVHPVRVFLASLFCLCAALVMNAQTTRILFIGNSYTNSNNLPEMVRQIGLSAGETIETSMVAPGGFTLEQHSTNPATQEAIAAGGWHHVVIQEQSQRPAFSPGQVAQQVLPYAALLVEQIRAVDPCTEVTFMMTWGRADGDAQNCAVYPPVCTYHGMQQRLRESYLLMAGNNDAWCAPVGQVWKTHREVEPTLDLYTSDGSHPSVRGSYLAATTLFSALLRRSAYSETVWSPASLNFSDVALIHSLVVNTVLDSLDTWNIGVNDPDASFTTNNLGGTNYSFTSNSTDGLVHWWSLGDGTETDLANFTHTYPGPGSYPVVHTVTDACGRENSAEYSLIISPTGIADAHNTATGHWILSDHGLYSPASTMAFGRLDLHNALGQVIWRSNIMNGRSADGLPPEQADHALFWSWQGADGEQARGRLMRSAEPAH